MSTTHLAPPIEPAITAPHSGTGPSEPVSVASSVHDVDSAVPSAHDTVVDLNGDQATTGKSKHAGHAASNANFEERAEEQDAEAIGARVEGPALSQGRKWFLLFVFSVAQFIDVCSYCGLFVFTDVILNDLDIKYESSSWIITAYSVTFASFLLLWGRVSDLWSAKPVFAVGFLGLGIFNLIISFMPNQYAYFVMRALSGVFASATIPAAFRLILGIFEPQELNLALTLFGFSGALAASLGLIFAGFFGFITAAGQMAGWRWFFRMLAIVIIPFSLVSFVLIPTTKGDRSGQYSQKEKLKRLDVVGCFLMFVSIVMLILGLTLGATYGFKTAKFLVPFLLTWPALVLFFVWEAKLPEGYALIPPSFWKIPNISLLMWFALATYTWWGVIQLPLIERVLSVYNEKPIIAAVRILPMSIAAMVGATIVPMVLEKTQNRGAKWIISGGAVLAGATLILLVFSEGEIHNNMYWRYWFPAFIVGSAGIMGAFIATNITVMTSIPPEASGVAGAMLQVCLQLGAVIALSIQAGLLTIKPGAYTTWYNVQASFWFQAGWFFLNAILIAIFFRPWQTAAAQKENAESGEKAVPAA